MRFGMIMAGGAGTRLWPMSRADRPKQLLPIIRPKGGGRARSLLEVAAARLEGLVPPERRYICTGEQYRAAIRAALPEFTDERILGEPAGRDTVNAIGFGAAVLEKIDPGAVFVVLTADHLIKPESVFRERVDLGFRLVEQDPRRLVTFSIKPTYAATGYGYVERGPALHGVEKGNEGRGGLAFKVERFVEKPDRSRAQAYFESGHFGWNSGMFVFSARTFMQCLERFKPESYAGLRRIQAAWGTPEQQRVLAEVYPALPKISVDYAVMEPATARSPLPASGRSAGNGGAGAGGASGGEFSVQVCTVLADVKWLDVGSWSSYAETLEADKAGNRVGGDWGAAGEGKGAVILDGRNNLVVGEAGDAGGHTVALLGVDDLVVVYTRDATLVMKKDRAEQLKKLYESVDEGLR